MKRLQQLHVGAGTTHDSVTLFPLWIGGPSTHGLNWKLDGLAISERDGAPAVGELVVSNPSSRFRPVLEGDLLAGGWQDRMAAASVVIAPEQRYVTQVVCVEQGRWHGTLEHRTVGGRGSLSVRHGNIAHGDLNHGDATGGRGSAQGEVWRRIQRYERQQSTATSSMREQMSRDSVRGAHHGFARISGQRGIVVGIGGRVIGAELFGSSAGLTARWDGIVQAALLDARLAPQVKTPGWMARDFVSGLQRARLELGDVAGAGRRIASHYGPLRTTGMALTSGFDDLDAELAGLVHLAAFDERHPLLENA